MARIEHIALRVDDLDVLCRFYERAFCAQFAASYVNAAKGFESRFSEHAVEGPRRTGDGYYESVVLDPEGNRIEITP